MWRPATCRVRTQARKRLSFASGKNKSIVGLVGQAFQPDRFFAVRLESLTYLEYLMRFCSILFVIGFVTFTGTRISSEEKKGTPGVVVDKDAKTVTIDAKIA